jgi:hypothetical protein
MTLDARKAEHLQAVVTRTFVGRQKTVVFAYRTGSGYTYAALNVIFRGQRGIDPQIPAREGTRPRLQYDTVMLAPLGTNFTGVALVADTSTPSAAAVLVSPKYEVVEVIQSGLLPGGTHIRALLRRLR